MPLKRAKKAEHLYGKWKVKSDIPKCYPGGIRTPRPSVYPWIDHSALTQGNPAPARHLHACVVSGLLRKARKKQPDPISEFNQHVEDIRDVENNHRPCTFFFFSHVDHPKGIRGYLVFGRCVCFLSSCPGSVLTHM